MARPYTSNNAYLYALNNISNSMNYNTSFQLVLVKLIPIFVVVLFGFLFKKSNTFSYCNLKGELCEKPIIKVSNDSTIETSCKVKESNGDDKDNNKNLSASIGFFAGFSLLLIVIIIIFSLLAYFYNQLILLSIIVILLSISIIIPFLTINQKDIWKGNFNYVLFKGWADIFWVINIILLILLTLFIIFTISKSGFRIFLGVDFTIIIILVIILIQVILYGIFRNKCTEKYDYQCVSTLEKIPYVPIPTPTPKPTSTPTSTPVPKKTVDIIKLQNEINKYKVGCKTTGVRHMDIKLTEIILGILSIIIVLVNYQDIFKTGAYFLTGRVGNDFIKGAISLIYLGILVALIVLTFK